MLLLMLRPSKILIISVLRRAIIDDSAASHLHGNSGSAHPRRYDLLDSCPLVFANLSLTAPPVCMYSTILMYFVYNVYELVCFDTTGCTDDFLP
jgi:hypothetical protein